MLKNLLLKEIIDKEPVALLFSGGVDSSIVLNLLLSKDLTPALYITTVDGVDSDDYKSSIEVAAKSNLFIDRINIPKSTDIKSMFPKYVDMGISKRKRATLLVLALFELSIREIKEEVIYSGLGSDAYYGIGRDFSIQCSLRGEKTPTLESMQMFRNKAYLNYADQYDALKEISASCDKQFIAPFVTKEVFDYFYNLTFEECNKPKQKQVLLNLYPGYFDIFKPRKQTNFQCGNSEFKTLLK